MSWTFGHAAVVGSGKARCGDSIAVRLKNDRLIAVVTDGAGSAARGEDGAELVGALVADGILAGGAIVDVVRAARLELEQLAAKDGVSVSDFATTLLGIDLGPEGGQLFQLGDGAIVVAHETRYEVPIPPGRGEFANTTWFVTMPNSESLVRTMTIRRPDGIVMFSDGLQDLVLDFATGVPHAPFFHRVFAVLGADGVGRHEPTCAWISSMLASPLVQSRTDDDTSLFVARWRGENA